MEDIMNDNTKKPENQENSEEPLNTSEERSASETESEMPAEILPGSDESKEPEAEMNAAEETPSAEEPSEAEANVTEEAAESLPAEPEAPADIKPETEEIQETAEEPAAEEAAADAGETAVQAENAPETAEPAVTEEAAAPEAPAESIPAAAEIQEAPAETAAVEKAPAPAEPQKRKKNWIPAAVIAAALAVGLIFGIPAYQKSQTYKEAMAYLAEEDYAKAAETFSSLENYKDAARYAGYCEGLEAVKNGEWSTADLKLTDAGDMEQAPQYLSYVNGKTLIAESYTADEYAETARCFEDAGGVLDSTEEAVYCRAMSAYLDENYAEAAERFAEYAASDAPDYWAKDFAAIGAKASEAFVKFDADDFTCIDALKEVADSGEILFEDKAEDRVNYIEGLEFYEQGLYYSAYSRFNSSNGLKDAYDLADSCIQSRPETGFIIRNTQSTSVSVTVRDTQDYEDLYIKVYDSNDDLVESLYIRDGSYATAYFPGGSYRMSVAWGDGDEWYGPEECFGPDGSYQRLLLSGSSEYYSFPGGASFNLSFNASDGNVGSKSTSYGNF